MRASVIIRSRNEADNLRVLLPILKGQTERDFEIVIIDNDSDDDSKKVGASFGARVLNIPYAEFTHPKSLNFGAREAKGEFLVYLSAHSFPLSDTWLADGLRHFRDGKVAGVYGPTLPNEDSSWIERYDKLPGSIVWALRGVMGPIKISKYRGMGVLGMTNGAIPKRLWEENNFDESFGNGGEDGEWARHFMALGHILIFEPKFSVRHCHRIKSWKDRKAQYALWGAMSRPSEFSRELLKFRKDYERYVRRD